MAQSGTNSAGMGFILGAVVVVLAGLVWFVASGGEMPGHNDAEIKIDLPDKN